LAVSGLEPAAGGGDEEQVGEGEVDTFAAHQGKGLQSLVFMKSFQKDRDASKSL
jgi:hypothetical protein